MQKAPIKIMPFNSTCDPVSDYTADMISEPVSFMEKSDTAKPVIIKSDTPVLPIGGVVDVVNKQTADIHASARKVIRQGYTKSKEYYSATIGFVSGLSLTSFIFLLATYWAFTTGKVKMAVSAARKVPKRIKSALKF